MSIVLVLTTPRSGSTWFCSTYLIHGNSTPGQEIITPLYPGYTHVGEVYTHMTSAIREQSSGFLIKGNCNTVVKLFPHNVQTAVPGRYSAIVAAAEKIYILVRKDFNAQLRSMYIAEQYHSYTTEDLPPRSVRYNAADYVRNRGFLQESLVKLAAIWRKYPHAELVYLEDLPRSGQYHQPVTWDQEPPVIDFDTERLFNRYIAA